MTDFADMHALWQIATYPPSVDPARQAELRREAECFDRKVRWRNRKEFAGVVLNIAVATWMGADASPAIQTGLG